MHPATLDDALQRLEREYAALLIALAELRTQALCDARPSNHVSDHAERAVQAALRALLLDDLQQAQHALVRASSGLYGMCEGCTRLLSPRRLAQHPTETRCTLCRTATLPVSSLRR